MNDLPVLVQTDAFQKPKFRLVTLKTLISCGYPLPSLSVQHYLVGYKFLAQITYAYANTVDRDQMMWKEKIEGSIVRSNDRQFIAIKNKYFDVITSKCW